MSNEKLKPFSVFVNETLTRQVEYFVHGYDAADAERRAMDGDIFDSYVTYEDIEEIDVVRIMELVLTDRGW